MDTPKQAETVTTEDECGNVSYSRGVPNLGAAPVGVPFAPGPFTVEFIGPDSSYADWEIGPGDRHRHVEAGQVVYEGTSGDCTICAHPLVVDRTDPA